MEYYVEKYNFYRKNKADQYKPYGKIKISEASKRAWGSIAIDWIMKLLLFRESMTKVMYNLILVIMDLLIKYIYFILYIKELGTEELIY